MTAATLNETDLGTLRRAETLSRRFESGIFPTGSGQHRHFAKLERLGLLVFNGWGRDIDGERPDDVPVYELTPFAVLVLKQRDAFWDWKHSFERRCGSQGVDRDGHCSRCGLVPGHDQECPPGFLRKAARR